MSLIISQFIVTAEDGDRQITFPAEDVETMSDARIAEYVRLVLTCPAGGSAGVQIADSDPVEPLNISRNIFFPL